MEPVVVIKLSLPCVAAHNAPFNMADPTMTLKITTQGMTSCDKDRYLCSQKMGFCNGSELMSCELFADNLGTDNSCEYSCFCGEAQDTAQTSRVNGISQLCHTYAKI